MNDLNLNPDKQKRKPDVKKPIILYICLVVVGFVLIVLAHFYKFSSSQSILLIVVGSFCCIGANILMLVRIWPLIMSYQRLSLSRRLKVYFISIVIMAALIIVWSICLHSIDLFAVIVAIVFTIFYPLGVLAERKWDKQPILPNNKFRSHLIWTIVSILVLSFIAGVILHFFVY